LVKECVRCMQWLCCVFFLAWTPGESFRSTTGVYYRLFQLFINKIMYGDLWWSRVEINIHYFGSSTPYVRFIGSINFIPILLRRDRHARHDPLVVTPNPRLRLSPRHARPPDASGCAFALELRSSPSVWNYLEDHRHPHPLEQFIIVGWIWVSPNRFPPPSSTGCWSGRHILFMLFMVLSRSYSHTLGTLFLSLFVT
jgi:hypothetical protein